MSSDAVKHFFDVNIVFIMFIWGVLQKYVKFLAKIPNETIGWINTIAYILIALLTGTAHAGVKDTIPDAVSVIISGITNAGWAMVLYETLGRTLLEKWLKLKKAVPEQPSLIRRG